jgi:transposase
MGRANFHREKQLEETCKKHEVFLLYLPPYSPDYNPIDILCRKFALQEQKILH